MYSIVQFYAASAAALFIAPNPVAARGDLGLLEGLDAHGHAVATALTSGFGLYGATASWDGFARHSNGTAIEGTVASLIYDQRYRGVGDYASDIHVNLFGMSLAALDPDRHARNVKYFAGFHLVVMVLPLHPPAPGFLEVADFNYWFNQPFYALRMSASVHGGDGDFEYDAFCDGASGCDPAASADFNQGPLSIRVDIADMSFDLGEVIPRDNEFTVRTYLRVSAHGPRGGEGGAQAQFFDPARGFGARFEPIDIVSQSVPVPEPAILLQVCLGFIATGARKTVRYVRSRTDRSRSSQAQLRVVRETLRRT